MPLKNQFDFAEDVIEAFTEGDCWALAEDIHRLTGWDIVAIGFASEAHEDATKRGWEHMANRRPDGLILDITGVYSEAGWLDGWNCGFARDTVVFEANDPAFIKDMERAHIHSTSRWARELLAASAAAELS